MIILQNIVDEDYKTYLTIVDEKVPEPPCYHYHGYGPKTGDNSHTFEYALIMLCSGTGATLAAYLLGTNLKKQKALELTRKLK